MLEICYRLLISLLLRCQRFGLLGRAALQRCSRGWQAFARSISRRVFFIAKEHGRYCVAILLQGWHRGGWNSLTTYFSRQPLLGLMVLQKSSLSEELERKQRFRALRSTRF